MSSEPETVPPLRGTILAPMGSNLVIAEWTDAGGSADAPTYLAPLHLHHSDDEAWYVLEGALCIRSGDRIVELEAGSCHIVPRGTPHTFWNPRSDPVRYLIIMSVTINAIIDEFHALTERTPETIAEIFARHDSTLLPQD